MCVFVFCMLLERLIHQANTIHGIHFLFCCFGMLLLWLERVEKKRMLTLKCDTVWKFDLKMPYSSFAVFLQLEYCLAWKTGIDLIHQKEKKNILFVKISYVHTFFCVYFFFLNGWLWFFILLFVLSVRNSLLHCQWLDKSITDWYLFYLNCKYFDKISSVWS